jgi:hypothetical protein
MAVYFMDSEFSCLLQPELLSLGLVTLDGREHYVELDLSTDIGHPLELLQSFFADDLQARVLGVTPPAHLLLGPTESRSEAEREVAIGERQYEIEQWIADSGAPAQPWVALDDDATLFRPGCPNLVVCDPTVGLTVSQLNELDVMLASNELRTGEARWRP